MYSKEYNKIERDVSFLFWFGYDPNKCFCSSAQFGFTKLTTPAAARVSGSAFLLTEMGS